MATVGDERLSDGKLDLVPMIDCIMLLLLFFILTMRFHRDELGISSLLPTAQGSASRVTTVTPPQTVTIRVFPAGMERGLQPSDYMQRLREDRMADGHLHTAWLRIGMRPALAIDLAALDVRNPRSAAIVEQVHAYVADALLSFETAIPADRKQQPPVTIACFSELPWKVSLLTYDAVRAFEASRLPPRDPTQGESSVDVDTARAVDFMPPRLRNSTSNEEGQELFEIVDMK